MEGTEAKIDVSQCRDYHHNWIWVLAFVMAVLVLHSFLHAAHPPMLPRIFCACLRYDGAVKSLKTAPYVGRIYWLSHFSFLTRNDGSIGIGVTFRCLFLGSVEKSCCCRAWSTVTWHFMRSSGHVTLAYCVTMHIGTRKVHC
jgi:hypothetical protein